MSESSEDFAALFEASTKARRFEKGQAVEGTIVAIGPEVAFVDVGGKGEATIEVGELKDANGALEVAPGERIQAVVVSTAGGIELSRKLVRRAAGDRQLEDAFHAGLPVEGRVEREVKGGFEVRVGRQRAFCPISQIDTVRSEPATHLGRVYEFRIVEYKEGGRNIVVSRRALLEEKQRAEAVEVRKAMVPGAVLTGRVAAIHEYGAFVDFGGGVQGLLHVSDMAWSRVPDVSEIARTGETITVKVLRVDDNTGKIALGLKQLGDDPWTTADQRYAPGQVRPGRVTRIAEFGAFVELEPGIEALAHASTFPPRGGTERWSAWVSRGMSADVEILTVDRDARRIGVALVTDREAQTSSRAPATSIAPGARLTGKVERHERFGVFVFLDPTHTGLIPTSETGVAEADVARTFPVGSPVEVIVLESDAAGRRLRLSAKAVRDAHEREELREYAARNEAGGAGGFGSLADKLRDALKPRG